MKLATFLHDSEPRVGLVDEAAGRIRPVAGVRDMLDLVERWNEVKGRLRGEGDGVPLASARLLAPIPQPRRNIVCVGKNYREHAREFSHSGFEAGAVKGAEIDEYPAVFSKMPSCVSAPGATVDLHRDVTQAVDYEVELALVIGKAGRNIAKADAYGHVFGYTIVNDVTARDRQRNHKQWFLGKALDGFCPMGPWIATADEVEPENLEVKAWVNGELRQNANTRDLIFDIPTLIATISAGMTLVPGDIIATGTPAGVGIGFNPPKFLQPGDVVRMSITGLGTLENRFA
ncbi:MAG TPA: fumarylacetoacetate hydrolase family protein [Beijerinckiaceae bacterium]|nr:fumarylacetoacetate hydrolase family protein [Beijerinckiaceae bacterium]